MSARGRDRADRVAAWAVGVGVGLIAMMLAWIVGARIAELLWEPPGGPRVALASALLIGIIVTVVSGVRLSRGR
ncbi:MAG: hypothetical protein WEA10_05995 [Actinomycetota bacterium]